VDGRPVGREPIQRRLQLVAIVIRQIKPAVLRIGIEDHRHPVVNRRGQLVGVRRNQRAGFGRLAIYLYGELPDRIIVR
jgi:hypothetical protein